MHDQNRGKKSGRMNRHEDGGNELFRGNNDLEVKFGKGKGRNADLGVDVGVE